MPKISKKTLQAMKHFTDSVIAAGNINNGDASKFFHNIKENGDYPQNVRDAAQEIYNIVKSGNYNAYESLQQLAQKIDGMLDDPEYPDKSETAELRSQEVMDAFAKFNDQYQNLDYWLRTFNSRNNYVELGKRNSALRPLMPMLNAYKDIGTFYDLVVLQSKKGNIESRIDKLRADDEELTKMTGFMKFEKESDPLAKEYKDLRETYEDKDIHVAGIEKDLNKHLDPKQRELYLEIEKGHIDRKAELDKELKKWSSEVEKHKEDVEKAQDALDDASKDYEKYKQEANSVGIRINNSYRSKQAYIAATEKHVEMQKKLNTLKERRMTFQLDNPITKLDIAASNYYKIKTAGSKWEKAATLFEDFVKKYSNPKYGTALITNFLEPDNKLVTIFKKNYPKGTVIGDQIAEVEKDWAPIKKLIDTDPTFFDRMMMLSGEKKDENGRYKGSFNAKQLFENITDNIQVEKKKALKKFETEDSYTDYLLLQEYNKQYAALFAQSNENLTENEIKEKNDKLAILKNNRSKLVESMTEKGSVNFNEIDEIVALEMQTENSNEVKAEMKAAEKKYIEDRDYALKGIDELQKIKIDQIKQNDSGIKKLREAVEEGRLTQDDYNKIVEDTFRTKDINVYYNDMIKKAENDLSNAKKNYAYVDKEIKRIKKDIAEEKISAGNFSYDSYLREGKKLTMALETRKEERRKLEGRYNLYNATKDKFDDVENQRIQLDAARDDFGGKEDVYEGIYNKIETYRILFTKCRKRVHEPVTEGNSSEYNRIWTALQAFGQSKEELMNNSPAQLKAKLTELGTAADEYKRAKDGQWYHIDFFSTDKRYFRLNFANDLSQFAQLENKLIGDDGFELPEESKTFINQQCNYISKKNDEEKLPPLNTRFETYVNNQADRQISVAVASQMNTLENYFRQSLKNLDERRSKGYFIDETDDDNTVENYKQLNWKSIYYLYALEEMHSFKPGETMMERLHRIQDLQTLEEINIEKMQEDKPENEKFIKVANSANKSYEVDFNKKIDKWKKLTNNDIKRAMDNYNVVVAEDKLEHELNEKETARLQNLAAKKNVARPAQLNNQNPQQEFQPGGFKK